MSAAALLLAASTAWGAPAAPAAAPESEDPREACKLAYDKSYEADWRISRERWDKDCDDGRAPKEILKDRQGDFVHECRYYYSKNKGDAKVAEWKIQIECAQGTAGERRLSETTGVAFREPPKPVPPPLPPAQRLYRAVERHGLVSKTPMELLPPGKPHRYLPIASYKVWRLDEADPPVCVIDTRRLDPETQAGPSRCADGSAMPRFLVDEGCTGRRETIKLKNLRDDPAERCTQADIDTLAAGIEKVLIKSGAAP
jgi:hypothetical protein